jgi:hypothetical protein
MTAHCPGFSQALHLTFMYMYARCSACEKLGQWAVMYVYARCSACEKLGQWSVMYVCARCSAYEKLGQWAIMYVYARLNKTWMHLGASFLVRVKIGTSTIYIHVYIESIVGRAIWNILSSKPSVVRVEWRWAIFPYAQKIVYSNRPTIGLKPFKVLSKVSVCCQAAREY